MQNEIDTLFEEGVHFYEQEKLDEAESKFLEALKIDSSSDEIKYNLALVYLEKKEYGKTNFFISKIKEFDCEEIIDELEKVEFEFGKDNPLQQQRITESEYLNEQVKIFTEMLNDEYLPKSIICEFCDSEIELSETERQNKYYICPECKNQSNIREKEGALKNEFKNKPDAELFEILIETENFRMEFVLAAKREIKRRNIQLAENEEILTIIKNTL